MDTIQWSTIEAECGDFRAGFVATFKKYANRPTDEKNANGITVKVTATSFARHMGIAERTFKRWLNQDGHGGPTGRSHVQLVSDARSVVRRDPQAVVEAINELPEADRKAIQAEVAQTLEPTKRALNAMKAVFAADVIEEAIELVRSADREHLPEIQAKCDELVLAVHERWILTEADSK